MEQMLARTRATKLQREMLAHIKEWGAYTYAGRIASYVGGKPPCYRYWRRDRFNVLKQSGWIEVAEADGFSTRWRISPAGKFVLAVYHA